MTTGPNTPEEPSRGPGQQQPPPPPQGYAPPPPGYGQGQMPPQPNQPMPGAPYSAPAPMRPDEEKLWAIAAHLGPLVLWIIVPLVVWLVFKDRSRFIERHAKEALNMQISYTIYILVATISILLLVGVILLPAVGIAWLVLMILATVKAASYQDYRYPLIFRFVS